MKNYYDKDLSESFPYVVQCCYCGAKIYRNRCSKLILNLYKYKCRTCGGKLKLIKKPSNVQILTVHRGGINEN